MNHRHDTDHRSRRRTAGLGLVLFSLVSWSCAPARPAETLRVMTFNIAAGSGDLRRTADVIRASGVDIAALQEVDVNWSERSSFADQAADLAAMLDMEVRFGAIYGDERQGERQGEGEGERQGEGEGEGQGEGEGEGQGTVVRRFGLAILSAHPIVEFRNHIIPRLSTQEAAAEPRPLPGFLEAVIDLRGRRIHVFNTHLDYRADPRVRVVQVAAMLELMPGADVPLILLGDLNAPPDAPELGPLLARFRDAWRGRPDAGYTYPASRPVRRIDYVLLSDHFAISAARVVPGEASDHLAVVADLIVR